MYAFLLVVHLLTCLALIGVVLIQSGKGGGLQGGAFGGSAQTVFGGRGATDIVTRTTMVLGGLFFVTSIVLALMSAGGIQTSGQGRSLVQEAARKAATTQPGQVPSSTPGQAAPAPGAPAGAAPAAPTTPAPTGAPPAGGK